MRHPKQKQRSATTAMLIDFRPPRIAITLVAAALLAQTVLPWAVHSGAPFAGAGIALLGFLLMIRAWWLFRLARTAICPTATASTLITHDVFGISRNPMYLGITMMLVGLAAAVGTLPFYVAAAVFFLFMDRIFCRYEEEKSLREFGSRYRAYRNRVRRWI